MITIFSLLIFVLSITTTISSMHNGLFKTIPLRINEIVDIKELALMQNEWISI